MKKTFIRKVIALMLVLGTALPLIPSLPAVAAEDNTEAQSVESRKTPLMGWASWNAYRTDISEEAILSQADKLIELGLADLGYTYVNIDDGWQNGRGTDGLVNINTSRFPSGMKYMADTIHAKGLKAGIYSDAGELTCGHISDNDVNNFNVGLYGHDEEDLNRYLVEWGYDFIKVDWCGGQRLGLSQKDRYTTIGRIVKEIEAKTGDDKIYNVCCWGFPGEWVVDCADSWRTGGDITNTFDSVLYQIDSIKSLAKYNGPGHVNDLDMMQVGNGMTYEEDKSHFAMWCMMSTPLMLGMDLNSISDETLSIVSNKELIAINQDPACIQASLTKTYGSVEAWTKDLGYAGSGKKAIALLNRSNKETTVTVSFSQLGLLGVDVVRDLWAHEDLATGDSYTVTIPAHGTIVLTASGTPVAPEENNDILVEDGSSPVAEMSVNAKPASVDLTKLGKYDWVHFASTTTNMKNGSGEIELYYDGSYVTYDNAAALYRWTNAEGTTSTGSSKHGIGVANVGAYMMVSTPCDKNIRTLTVAVGSYSADMKIEMIVGGKIIDSVNLPGGDQTKVDKLVTMTYSSDIPTTAYLRWTVTSKLGVTESVNVEGVALDIEVKDNSLSTPELTVGNAGAADITAKFNMTVVNDNSRLHIVTRNAEGSLNSVYTETVNSSDKPMTKTFSPELPIGFVGTLEIYLWDEYNRPLSPMKEIAIDSSSIAVHNVGFMTANQLIKDGALLIDVRTPEEFESGHIEGAVNIVYTDIRTLIEGVESDKNRPIILYCSAAKRSAQALEALVSMGYNAVFNLGSMDNFYAQPLITFTSDTCKVVTKGEAVKVSFTASLYDSPSVYVSAGKNSSLEDALPISEFKIPETEHYYLTLKAYLVQDGVCYAEASKEFIYWSEDTVDTFATDIEWSEATIGWGSIRKNRSVDGNILTLAGKTFSHGIGTHATSSITMDIPEGAVKFLAVAGCDLEKSGGETMMFFVYIDGVQVDHSSLIKIGQHYVFDVDIPEGAKVIRLYAYEGSYGGNTNDHADWTVAGFFNEASEG